MFSHLQIAIWLIYALTGLVACFAIVILSLKARTLWLKHKTDACLSKLNDYLTYVQYQIEEEDRLRIPNFPLNKFELRVLQKVLVEWIERFSGIHRDKLIALCDDLGLVEMNLKRIRHPLRWVRIDAAYYLGGMRAKRAVPLLFHLFYNSKWDSAIFIIARSIAKSATNASDLKAMAKHLLKKKKHIHNLVADIIQETSVDDMPLFIDFLKEEDPALVKFVVCGQKDHTEADLNKQAM